LEPDLWSIPAQRRLFQQAGRKAEVSLVGVLVLVATGTSEASSF
jgi:hypothetical protein